MDVLTQRYGGSRGTTVLTAPDGVFEDVRRAGPSPAAVPAGACPEPVACAQRLRQLDAHVESADADRVRRGDTLAGCLGVGR
jgi:hypothetical protein